MRVGLLIVGLLLVGIVGGVASADVPEAQIDVQAGWGGHLRTQRWGPVFVTVSARRPRNAVLNITWPGGGNFLMHIQQHFAIDQNARTFPLILPVRGWMLDRAGFTLSDADTGKTLAFFPPENATSPSWVTPGQQYQLIGISGDTSSLEFLNPTAGDITTGYLEPRLIPTSAIGYDALNALILNAPNLVRNNFGSAAISDAQQQAIVDWVRAGGNLVIWPGDTGFPESSPLVDALPARLGARDNIELDDAEMNRWTIPSRFKKLAPYSLQSVNNATAVPIFDGKLLHGFAGRVGLGRIVILPLNVGEIRLREPSKTRAVWRSILQGIISYPPAESEEDQTSATTPASHSQGSTASPDQQDDYQAGNASMRIADHLGTVKGAGQVGFGYVAFVLSGLMVVVGPVDWFVLKKLGRQPWTWVTTSGWIALITLGAIYTGHVFKSGDLTYRTLQTVDQVGDVTVSTTDYVALYSSRTRDYGIEADRSGWWQLAGVNDYSDNGYKTTVDFHQTEDGNTPEKMIVNVWSLRFLRGDTVATGSPMISADIRQTVGRDSIPVIGGTLKNLTDRPLKNIRFATGKWTGRLVFDMHSTEAVNGGTQLASGATTTLSAVDIQAASDLPHDDELDAANPYGHQSLHGYGNNNLIDPDNFWKTVWNLNPRRERRLRSIVKAEQVIVLYAETVDPPPAAALAGPKDHENNWRFIRAVVPLRQGTP